MLLAGKIILESGFHLGCDSQEGSIERRERSSHALGGLLGRDAKAGCLGMLEE